VKGNELSSDKREGLELKGGGGAPFSIKRKGGGPQKEKAVFTR